MATKIVDLELTAELPDLDNLTPYRRLLILWRWRGMPLGQTTLDIPAAGVMPAEILRLAAANTLGDSLTVAILEEVLPPVSPAETLDPPLPSGSVVICTRDRPDDLRTCLDSLCTARPSEVEVVVVDNAPADERTRQVARNYPVRYVVEPRPGLNWARHCGAQIAQGEIVLYTDDDVLVDPGWIDAMRRPFVNPHVAAVTGLVMPFELETEAQELFEQYGGFGRGFSRREFTARMMSPAAAGQVGAGASMAFRRRLVNQLALFAVELDCGTAAKSAGDTYAFYRLLALGYHIVYNPAALAWHRHRRSNQALQNLLHGYSLGVYTFLWRVLFQHGDFQALEVGGSWFLDHHLRQLWRAILRRPDRFPLKLTLAEIRGCLAAPWAYRLSRRREREFTLKGSS